MNQIYFVGYDGLHAEDFKYNIPEGFTSYLLVITTTPACFRIQGKLCEYPAHTAILYPPNHEIWYSASGEPYGNHWLRIATDETFITGFPQKAVPFPVSDPDYCRSLMQLLTWEVSQLVSTERQFKNTGIITQDRDAHLLHHTACSSQNDLITNQLLRILFRKLQNDVLNSHNSCYDHELLSLRREIALHPEYPWKVSDMAKQLHISTGYLQMLYKQKFHSSCMDDVITYRLNKARDLLTYTAKSMLEIAEECGYSNQEHFSRQFRKNIGVSPGLFRKENRT